PLASSISADRPGTGMITRFPELVNVLKVLRCRLWGRADLERWRDLRSRDFFWEERTRLIAGEIEPGSRVIEFGAGRRKLETYLDRTCAYTPADLVERGSGTFVCNLNLQPLPDLSEIHADVA